MAETTDTPAGEGDTPRLVALAATGDEAAWRELVDRYSRRVFALIRARCGRRDLAEEITQSVFATVCVKLTSGEYGEQGRFESWLFRVAINRVRDEIRRQRRHAAPTDPSGFVRLASDEPDDRHGDDEQQSAELAALRSAVAELGERDREIIHLRHHAQLSFKQMAELLDEPMGTLLARHHRALRKLRDIMEQSTSGDTRKGGAAS